MRWFAPHEPRAWQADAWPVILSALREGGGPMLVACTGAGKSVLQRAIIAAVLDVDRPGIVVLDVPTLALVTQMVRTLRENPALSGSVGEWSGRRKQVGRVTVACRASLPALADRLLGQATPVRLYMVDEAHLQPDRVQAFHDALQPARRLAVTATPYRSAPDDSLAMWDRVVVRYTLAQALQDGVLVPWSTRELPPGVAMEIDEACAYLIREHGEGPGIVDATDVNDAEAYAVWLNTQGLRATAVHSRGMTMAQRDAVRDRLRTGELDVVVHVSTLVEGVDWPWLSWVCLRREVGSRVRLVQQVGRGLRCDEGKSRCVVLDPHGLMQRIGLVHPDAVGAVEDDIADELAGVKPKPKPEDGPIKAKDVVWVVGRAPLATYIADCHTVAASAGLVEPRTQADREAMGGHATMRQLAALEQRIAKGRRIWLPDPLSLVARAICEDVRDGSPITYGCASDLLAMMTAAGKRAHAHHQNSGEWRADWPVPSLDLPDGYTLKR